MADEYVYGINPFNDVLVEMVRAGIDLKSKKTKFEINESFKYILENVLEDEKISVHLKFDIVDDNGWCKLIGKNSISALWLSGVFISDVDLILNNTRFVIGDRKYVYNKKKCELIYKSTIK